MKYTIKEIKKIIFPYTGIQPKKWQNRGYEISMAWSDAYKQAMREVWDTLTSLEVKKKTE